MLHHGSTLAKPVELRKILSRGLQLFPDPPALATSRRHWSWRDLDNLSDICAGNLRRLGLAAGDRVASFLPNCDGLFIHYLDVIKADMVAVPLDHRYTAFEIDHAIEVSAARGIVYQAERRNDIAASRKASALAVSVVHGEGGTNGGLPHAHKSGGSSITATVEHRHLQQQQRPPFPDRN